ncbi:lysine--tRNA ligase [Pseudonocardia sp. MH-G8]|uniref:lysine--tRNA ligase n=1 Tax=Pseudonocardia sp. MH-G8 TaxID=1854588 RepID=UPI000BA0CC8E|nr:lysine--tRNA ligase [Pseudonocardia sp. MH-G8]OZM80667.1 lysine--tRNA ligase [Pseudonocardia sp. MH-G8]
MNGFWGSDWVARFADEVIATADRRKPGATIVCASGLSPSGPIHLGNLREVMTPHLVADEIKRRGRECRHLLSWDDYDRFRRVPAAIDPSYAEHIGKPLTSVPAPPGSRHTNWAEHFKASMIGSLAALGIEVDPISQTAMYTSGAYTAPVLLAMRERKRIDEILGRYRTKESAPDGPSDGAGTAPAPSEYFPFKPYCLQCGKDLTTVVRYDDDTTEMTYACGCGHTETVLLREFTSGKLVWKVDWPMRWVYEGVDFEPSGVDHTSPGSSFQVGGLIVDGVFGGKPPIGPMYAFVGISGMAKMSSSRGAVPTPADALAIMEPAVLRWLYARRRPNQSFKIAFDQEIYRLYDEWDGLERRVAEDEASAEEQVAHARSTQTALGEMPLTPRPFPYRTLASIVDITTGAEEQTLRIVQGLDTENRVTDLHELRPRLDCAERWSVTYLPADQHTTVRAEPDRHLLASLDEGARESLWLLSERLTDDWCLGGLTSLVYGVPKLSAGLPPDAGPTQELKAAQREFFALLYRLLVGRDTGPRLPTLLLAVGPERVRALIDPAGIA